MSDSFVLRLGHYPHAVSSDLEKLKAHAIERAGVQYRGHEFRWDGRGMDGLALRSLDPERDRPRWGMTGWFIHEVPVVPSGTEVFEELLANSSVGKETEAETRDALEHLSPELIESIARGVEEAEAGRTVDLGDFAQYLDEEELQRLREHGPVPCTQRECTCTMPIELDPEGGI